MSGPSPDPVWRRRQVLLNDFTQRYVKNVVPLVADGLVGPITRRRIKHCQWWLGWDHRNLSWSPRLERMLKHPALSTLGVVARGVTRRREHNKNVAMDLLRLRALGVARRCIGIMEEGGNNRGSAVERIITYALGQVGEPWCVDFVIWCYGHAGSQVVKPNFPRAVSLMLVRRGVVETSHPQPGDIVRFIFDHTGIFERDNGNGTITTIEGNTGAVGAVSDSSTGGDGVYRKVRPKSLVYDYLHVVV